MADDPTWVRKLNRFRVNARQPLADLANFLAGTREDGSHFEARGLHANTSRDLTRMFGRALPPSKAVAAADALGYANEILPGALQAGPPASIGPTSTRTGRARSRRARNCPRSPRRTRTGRTG